MRYQTAHALAGVALAAVAPLVRLVAARGCPCGHGRARLRAAGWHTIAQDKATSVVWGMPGAAVEVSAAAEVLPINAIGEAIAAHIPTKTSTPRRAP